MKSCNDKDACGVRGVAAAKPSTMRSMYAWIMSSAMVGLWIVPYACSAGRWRRTRVR